MASKASQKTTLAIEKILIEIPTAKITLLALDLRDLHSITNAANKFISMEVKLDILINNAGVESPMEETVDGVETHFLINHLGQYHLTNLLIPHLLKSIKPRIVNVSSDAYHFSPKPTFTLKGLLYGSPMQRYSLSKLCNILHMKSLVKKYPLIYSNTCHPGGVSTEIDRNVSKSLGVVYYLFWPLFLLMRITKMRADKGCWNTLFLATMCENKGGHYIPFCREEELSKVAKDWRLAEELCKFSEKLVKEKMVKMLRDEEEISDVTDLDYVEEGVTAVENLEKIADVNQTVGEIEIVESVVSSLAEVDSNESDLFRESELVHIPIVVSAETDLGELMSNDGVVQNTEFVHIPIQISDADISVADVVAELVSELGEIVEPIAPKALQIIKEIKSIKQTVETEKLKAYMNEDLDLDNHNDNHNGSMLDNGVSDLQSEEMFEDIVKDKIKPHQGIKESPVLTLGDVVNENIVLPVQEVKVIEKEFSVLPRGIAKIKDEAIKSQISENNGPQNSMSLKDVSQGNTLEVIMEKL
jgi:NAD(P)-dependent dehydrogenase (short-subunit alcohol dehydrogenase family)